MIVDKEKTMKKYKLGDMEKRFAELIWDNAPISTRELISLCEDEFDWKRTTTYTMLKRLSERNIFENDGGTVKIVTNRDDYFTKKGEAFLEEAFNGSLPNFITAFTKKNKLTKEEIADIQKLIDEYRDGV